MRFRLSEVPIQVHPLECPGAGGFVTFEGRVRNGTAGRPVDRLEYEAYEAIANPEAEVMISEACDKFGLLMVEIVHRVGTLAVGEMAVHIQVAAPHRRAAFAGCEWLIDQLKHRVPIWKREHFADGDSGWVGIDSSAANPELRRALTERQTRLAEVGEAGQARLSSARVLLVGVGGLGAASLPYLAAASIGTLGLIDADEVEISNLHRQIIYKSSESGRLKVDRAAEFVRNLNPTVNVETHPARLTAENVERMVDSYDIIVDGTDSFETKFLLNDVCRAEGKALITASVHRFEGQLLTVMPDGPCVRCLFPEQPPASCVGTCAEDGILGVVPGLLGVLQATEVLKLILELPGVHDRTLLLLDTLSGETTILQRRTNLACPLCHPQLRATAEQLEFASLVEARNAQPTLSIVDIRELDEQPALAFPHVRLPMSSFEGSEVAGPILLVCASGARSYRLTARLRAQGRRDVFSLSGGLASLR